MNRNLIAQQIKNKVRTHGPAKTAGYCLQYGWNLFTQPVRRNLLRTYSQAGEDLVLDRLLNRKATGFYVDVGAHHPTRLNNTKRFYDRGWRGINVEPNPEWHRLFEVQRPRDINVNGGVATKSQMLTFYELDAAGFSTFSLESVHHAESLGITRLRTLQVPVRPLREILTEFAADSPIDFLSVDTEGFDVEVLESNDWERWRPRLVCIEAASDEDVRNEPVLEDRDAVFQVLDYQRCATIHQYGRVLNALYKDVRDARE